MTGGEPTAPAWPDPVFVGGTGRSGTHAVAQLLGASSRYHYIPREIRFHADGRAGLPALLSGRARRRRFLRVLRGHWWARSLSGRTEPSGLQTLVERADFDAAVESFDAAFDDDPLGASRGLVRSLLDPLASAAGKPSWVEQSTRTADAAPTLLALFPDMKLIHVIRDGRDVACSLMSQAWGPDTAAGGLERWERRLPRADAGARALPAERVLVVHLEDLVAADRERSYERLCEFLDLGEERGMREYFDAESVPANANIERWRRELPVADQERLTADYEETLARLSAAGVGIARDLARRAGLALPAAG